MNIILEGSDASGKSTLANILSDELERFVVKGSSFESATGTNEELYNHFKKLSNIDNAVIDRGIYSNKVYATLYDGYTILTDEQRCKIQEKLADNKDIVVYLTAPKDVLIQRLNERGDEYVKGEMIPHILKEYDKIMREAMQHKVNVLTYDTSQFGSEDIAESIITILTKSNDN